MAFSVNSEDMIANAIQTAVKAKVDEIVKKEIEQAVDYLHSQAPNIASTIMIKLFQETSFERMGNLLRIDVRLRNV